MNKNFLLRALLPLLLATLLPLACGTPDLVVELTESQVNDLLQNTANDYLGEEMQVQVTGVDLMPGLIRVQAAGEPVSGINVSGSMDITLVAQDGALLAQVVSIDILGITIDNAQLTRINEELSRAFSDAAAENRQVEFTNVTITDDVLRITARVNLSD